jgi:hypothetical protein
MIEPKRIRVDGLCFDMQPLPALKAIGLDKKILTLAIPILGGLKNISLDSDIDFEAISRGLYEAFNKLDTAEFEILVSDILCKTAYMPEHGAPEELTKTTIDRIFQGSLQTLYKLIFEVMRFNKFTPFVLAEGGGVAKLIGSFVSPIKKKKKPGRKSGISENLLET